MKGLQFNETFRFPSDFWSVSLEEKQLQTMSLLIPQVLPRLQESQILQNSSKNLANFTFLTRTFQVCTRIANLANLFQYRTFLTRF